MADRYWRALIRNIEGQTLFSNPANWSLTSGGVGGASVPSIGDIAHFDNNSHYSGNRGWCGCSIDIEVLCTIDVNMTNYSCLAVDIIDGGILSLQEDLIFNAPESQLAISGTGIFRTNNYNVTISSAIYCYENSVVSLGTSTITLGNPDYIPIHGYSWTEFSCYDNATVDASQSTIILKVLGSNGTLDVFDDRIIGNLQVIMYTDPYNNQNTELYVCGNSSYKSLSIVGNGTVFFNAWSEEEQTITITDEAGLILQGNTEGGLILTLSDPTYPYEIIVPGGTVNAINCDISYSNVSGGATFYALTTDGNIDGGNNIGWLFEILPPSGSIILQSLPNIQIVKVGSYQQYLLSIVSSGGIIEDYITSDVTWSSSNENIATVSSSGLVYAVSLGNVTISATYGGVTLSIGIKTTRDVRSIQMEPERLSPHPYTYTATLGVSSRTGVK
jgi:hypothetical protein